MEKNFPHVQISPPRWQASVSPSIIYPAKYSVSMDRLWGKKFKTNSLGLLENIVIIIFL
jgi:hypothetical protein